MSALARQNIELPVYSNTALVIFKEEAAQKGIERASALRKQGLNVEALVWNPEKTRDDYAAYALKNRISKVEFIDN